MAKPGHLEQHAAPRLVSDDVESKTVEVSGRSPSDMVQKYVPGELHPDEGYRVILEGCARVFRFGPGIQASQTGTIFLTHYRLRFVPKPCRCGGQVRGPPVWHSPSCTVKGPVSPWGSYLHTWPPCKNVMKELCKAMIPPSSTSSPSSSQESLEAKQANGSLESSVPMFFIDVPVMGIQRICLNSRDLRIHCRDGRIFDFEMSSDQEGEGLVRVLSSLAFPKDDVTGSFAFQTRCRVGLGWDVFDPDVDASRTLLSRSRIRLRKIVSPCKTYPEYVYLPETLTDDDIVGSVAFRSMGRLPVPVWAHPTNGSLLVRSSQPLVGLWNRSAADEKLIRELCGDRYVLLDARSRAAALANRARGRGTESIERGYEGALELTFCDLGNIHHLKATVTNLQRFFAGPTKENTWASDTSTYYSSEIGAWLSNVSYLLKAAMRIVNAMEVQGVSAWTHCSDGWDRTAQMCALAQMIMDPEYRTITGFAISLEKNFAHYGFKFRDRARGVSLNSTNGSTVRSSTPGALSIGSEIEFTNDEAEVSPVLLLFLDCVYQLIAQYPEQFEFNEMFLIALADAYVSGRFGNFLCNSESERIEKKVKLQTRSVWDWLCNEPMFRNPDFVLYPGVLYPNVSLRAMRLFERYWARYDWLQTDNPVMSEFY